MTLFRPKRPNITPARNGCQCYCHRTGAKHIADCCGRFGRQKDILEDPVCRMPEPKTLEQQLIELDETTNSDRPNAGGSSNP